MKRSVKIAVAGLIVAAFALPASADAAYPGSNGKLAFVRNGQIWTMNADGTGEQQLTSGSTTATEPEWSPNGTKILYTRGTSCGTDCTMREVRLMNADGTGDTHVYGPGSNGVFSATWAPDGKRIAFFVPEFAGPGFFIYFMYTADPDGSHPSKARAGAADPGSNADLEWSPLGDEIAFTYNVGYDDGRFVNAWPVGSGDGRLIAPQGADQIAYGPFWLPDAGRVGFVHDTRPASLTEIAAIGSDGTDYTQLTTNSVQEYGGEWSPDGTKIVYSGQEPGCAADCNPELHVMNADGTDPVRLTETAASETGPDWQPVIGAPPPGYARPKGATPLSVPLVPAYPACTSPNRTHGAPLAFGSCDPPSQASPRLTVGTPDANGAPAKMIGSLRLDTVAGDPATPTNEATVKLTLKVRDVRCLAGDTRGVCYADNTQGGRDYSGGLRVRIPLRLTDRYNLPSPGGNLPGTMQDTPFEYNLDTCSPTPADPSVGSTCSLTTGTNAILGTTESRRAVMELGQVEVLDGGASGDVSQGAPSSGMSPFLRQGLFIP